MESSRNPLRFVAYGLGLIIALFVVFGSWTIVSPQEVGIVTRLGALNRTLGEGMHFKLPLVEDVTTMTISEQKLQTQPQVYSKDAQTVQTQIVVNYQLDKSQAERVYREVRNDFESIIIGPIIAPVVEEVFSRYTANELIVKRPQLPSEVRAAIVDRLEQRGIIVKGIEFTFDFDEAYEAAIRNKQVQEQQALAQVNITAQEKEKKAQEILKAEALAEKTRLEAQALQSSQGEKLIEKIKAEAQLEAAKRWNGALPTHMYGSSPLPLINVGTN